MKGWFVMEHRSPCLPEFTLKDWTLDAIPVDKRDLFRFFSATNTLDDEAAERLLGQIIELAGLVDDMVRFYRRLKVISAEPKKRRRATSKRHENFIICTVRD